MMHTIQFKAKGCTASESLHDTVPSTSTGGVGIPNHGDVETVDDDDDIDASSVSIG